MKRIIIPVIIFLVALDFLLLGTLLAHYGSFPALDPMGIIANKERDLLVASTALGLSIIIPVIIAAFVVAFRYRDRGHNSQRKYTPDSGEHTLIQVVWWSIPTIAMIIFGILAVRSTHELDPYKPIKSDVKPVRIQVVALQWKWLFIYPEQNIATINYIVFPEKTPINFELTADAPMNSFWIPRLGGQIYAMSGMVTKTHLMADKTGEYAGSSAEISGVGFAGMRFIAKAATQKEFERWVESVRYTSDPLDMTTYTRLARPSENTPKTFYSSVENGLYNKVVMKYMHPSSSPEEKNPATETDAHSMHEMQMEH